MEPNDPVLLQQQQTEQLRRQQHAEIQRQQHELQLLEDQELEQRLREQEDARQNGASKEVTSKPRRRWFGEGSRSEQKSAHKSADDHGAPMATASAMVPSTSGLGASALIIGLVLAGVLGYASFSLMGKDSSEMQVMSVAPASRELPRAQPGEGLSNPLGAGERRAPGLPEVSSPLPADAQVASAPGAAALPGTLTPVIQAAASDATSSGPDLTALAASAETETAQAKAAESAPETRAEIAALQERVTSLENQLSEMLKQRESHEVRQQPAVRKQAVAARPAKTVAKTAQRSGKKAPSPAEASAAAPAMQAELLAVDLWDGRPSVVVGTGAPGDKRIRVLQPGEQLNGVGLHSADAAVGQATFSVGNGRLVTLSVEDEKAHP